MRFTPPPMQPAGPEFFVVQITNVSAAPAYQFQEAWSVPNGPGQAPSVVQKVGGRFGDQTNPGYAVNGATFALNDLALCRSADGAGGLVWELAPLPGPPVVNGQGFGTNGAQAVFADATYYDVTNLLGFTSLSVFKKGTYLASLTMSFHARVSALNGAAGAMGARLFNITANAPVNGSLIVNAPAQVANVDVVSTASVTLLMGFDVDTNLRIEAYRAAGPTWVTSDVGCVIPDPVAGGVTSSPCNLVWSKIAYGATH